MHGIFGLLANFSYDILDSSRSIKALYFHRANPNKFHPSANTLKDTRDCDSCVPDVLSDACDPCDSDPRSPLDSCHLLARLARLSRLSTNPSILFPSLFTAYTTATSRLARPIATSRLGSLPSVCCYSRGLMRGIRGQYD